jgi:hypothetical protein
MNVQELIDGLEKKKEELRRECELKINSIDATIQTLLGSSTPIEKTPPQVKKNGEQLYSVDLLTKVVDKDHFKAFFTEKAFKRKVVSILVAENRFMHIRELAEIVGRLDPNLKSDDLAKDISVALFAAKKDKNSTLTSITIGKMLVDSFWGSKNWLDENGKPKTKYMYDLAQLSENRKQKTVL